jgi:hypothetical protein
MAQILWLWSLLPAGVVTDLINILIIVGVIGVCSAWIGKKILFFNQYAPTLKLIGIVCLVVGVFFKGGEGVEKVWRARVADLQQQVAAAEKKSEEANGKIETVYVDRIKVVKETQVIIKNKIQKNAKNIDLICKLDPEVITILNGASEKPSRGDKK